MLVVGLTGGIGSGKTTVARMLERHGAIVIDCDGLGRLVVEPDGRAYQAVIERFGSALVSNDRHIDRPALARIVFGDPTALDDLNAITHPAIDAEIDECLDAIRATKPDAVVVLDMAVLVETSLGRGRYHVVVVVETPMDLRIERLLGRGMSEHDARARVASQASDEARRAVADYLVVNDGDLTRLEHRVDQLWPDLVRRA